MSFLDKITNWSGNYNVNSTIIVSDTTNNIRNIITSSKIFIDFIGDANWKVTTEYDNYKGSTEIITFIATAIITPNSTKYLALNNVQNLGNGQITAIQICQDKVITATGLIYLLDISDPNNTVTLITQDNLKLNV